MSDRKHHNLRGPVKACTEEYSYPDVAGPDGKVYPGSHSVHITDYDSDGRILATRSHNSEGSQWSVRYDYDASGRLRMTASGNEGGDIHSNHLFLRSAGPAPRHLPGGSTGQSDFFSI